MSLSFSLQDPAQGLQTASPSKVTGLLKSFGGSDIPVTIIPGYFKLNFQEYCHFPFYHMIKGSKCFGKNIYLRFNGEIKDNMVSATQPKEFIMQHYRDLKVYKDQVNANVQCNTLSNSPLQKQIARFHYLYF